MASRLTPTAKSWDPCQRREGMVKLPRNCHRRARKRKPSKKFPDVPLGVITYVSEPRGWLSLCPVSAAAPSSRRDRKSTRLNSSHGYISYAVFCLKKKKKRKQQSTTQTKR